MTDDPIDLDSRRTVERLLQAKLRRCSANGVPAAASQAQPHLESLEDQMLAEPERSLGGVLEKWWFLLDRYSATPDVGNERIQKLIKRAIEKMERLSGRQERK